MMAAGGALTRGLARGRAVIASLLRRLWRFLTGRARGRWIRGTTRAAEGRLSYAPWARPWRSYQLYLPGGIEPRAPSPLVVMLHGCTQTPQVFAKGTRMNRLADEHGFIALYPAQRRLANPYRCWNWFDPAALRGRGEAAIVLAMIREVAAARPVDASRIYLVGISAGGALASVLASCHGSVFAACALHSAVMYRAADSLAAATRVMHHGSRADPDATAREAARAAGDAGAFVPTFVLQGSEDRTVVPVNADQIVAQALALHATFDRGASASVAHTTQSRTAGGRAIHVDEYRSADRVLVRQVTVAGLGHAWSGGDARYKYNDPEGPDATRMIWEFLSAHRR
jgi:poly(hydroxyalkanoate) depolymerase family esterase